MEMDGMRAGPSSQDAPGPSDGDLRSSDDEYSEYSRHHPSFSNKPYSPPPLSDEEEEMDLGQQMEHVFARPRSPFVPPSRRKDAPLASILDPTLDGLDPRRFFPEFNSDKVLRFSRLFANNIKSSSKAQIWWLSETFHSKPPSAEERADKAKRRHSHRGSLALSFGPAATEEELMEDQEKQLLTLEATDHGPKKKVQLSDVAQPWRFGPAKMWYDQLGVPPLATSCTYGVKEEVDAKSELCAVEVADDEPIPADTFLPLNLVQWEDDIVYDGEEMRDKLIKELKSRDGVPYGGWIPTQTLRTYEAFQTARESGQLEGILSQRPGSNPSQQTIVEPTGVSMEPSCSFSLFPNESSDVISAPWEDDVVWGDEDIAHNSQPKVLTIDLFDDPVLFGMPEDRAMDEFDPNDPKKESQYTKKSKMILGQVAQRQKQEEEEQMESSVAQLTDKDPFNLSLDDYYTPKTINKSGNAVSSLIQHSIPSQNIHRCFFPTHMTPFKLRHWHRMPLSKRILKQIGGRYIHILGLNRHIRKIAEQRERAKAAEGGGDIFLMREVSDISGRDGELLLVEYSEEHPILLSQPGMASRIRNYHKRRTPKDPDPTMDFGELAFTHNSPFLGQLSAGQTLQSIENNLYRAPIHRHAAPSTHFLLIRSKQGYFIRRCPALFLAGQQSPLYEVPSPNSKRATVFVRDFLMAFIYRLFWASNDTPRRLKIEDIKAAFPHYAESSVRKRLKVCSDFKRMGTGMEQNYWVLRSDFRLPSKEEVLAMVTPEMCCAQYSMLAAEQRLKDAGYGENYFFTPEEGDDEEDEVRIEDEIKCAPWNTSRAFVAALRGKCVLDQTGIADPSGCGHGFSYVRVSSKPQKEDIPQVPKRLVTGTNADLRKLPLKEAKEICRDYGVKEEEISALSRWEIIDVIRTLSTQAAKAKNEASGEKSLTGMARFARGNFRFNMADMQDKYKKHCQHVFDLQNSVLANPEELSTDEGSSGEESDNEELANRLESMLSAAKGKKTISAGEKERMEKEDEERERRDLKRMLHGENIKGGKEEKGKEATEQDRKNAENIGKDVADAASKLAGITANQKLKIFRTYRNPDGTESTRTEVITRPQLIEAYARIRMTKDDTFIQVYAQMDEQFKEERRKEKRRLQDQLRRVKKNMERVTNRTPQADKKPKPFNPNLAKMRCSACGGTGHMKTNKNCPLWRGRRGGAEGGGGGDSVNVAMTDEEYSSSLPSGELVALEGTKLKISKKIINQHNENLRREAVRLHIPRSLVERAEDEEELDEAEADTSTIMEEEEDDDEDDDEAEGSSSGIGRTPSAVKKRPTWMNEDSEYLAGPSKSVQRLRADPKVSFATLLTEIVNELKALEGSEHLLFPVSAKKVKDYYDIVKNPMDLQTVRHKIGEQKYELRATFLMDLKLMVDNSVLYNGQNHVISVTASSMFELASKRLVEKEEHLIRLEKAINPLLDENDRVGFSYILAEIIQKCKNIPKSVPFHTPVDARKTVGYYERISRPMDLGTMERRVKDQYYTSVATFMDDIQQILTNSTLFNGPPEKSLYSKKAEEIVAMAQSHVEMKKAALNELEINMGGRAYEEEYEGENSFPSASENEDDDMDPVREDLAMSEDEDDNNDHRFLDYDESEWQGLLENSTMASAGHVQGDLAMSDSDDESIGAAKRPRLDDDLEEF